MKVNENDLARMISNVEGKCKELSIAQIKEALKVVFVQLANGYKMSEVVALIEKHQEKGSLR